MKVIERTQRSIAGAIASGEKTPGEAHEKAILYGLLGRAMLKHDIDPVLFESTAQISTFFDLTCWLNLALLNLADRAYETLTDTEKDKIERLFNSRLPGKRAMQYETVGHQRLAEGAKNAGDVISYTLRTIGRLQSQGHTITKEGLSASCRVPFAFASVHIDDLVLELAMRDWWPEEHGGDNGLIYRDDAITFSSEKGLGLVAFSRLLDAGDSTKVETDPRIGCPASFDKDYIKTLFQLAADQAVASKLILTS